jgi:hypothetical protein
MRPREARCGRVAAFSYVKELLNFRLQEFKGGQFRFIIRL